MCCCKKKIGELEKELAEVKAELEAMKAQRCLPPVPLSRSWFNKGPSDDTHTLEQNRIRKECGGPLQPGTPYLI